MFATKLPLRAVLAASERWPDRLGTWASTACAIHCLVTPFLISGSVVFAKFLPGEDVTHRTLAVGIALIGTLALIRGLRRHHRKIVLWLMLCGFSLVGFTALFGDVLKPHWLEACLTVCGSLLMITAHRLNHTFCEDCACVASTFANCNVTTGRSV